MAIAELLIAKGADVNTKNKHGRTPYDYLHHAGWDMEALLRKHGAKPGK